MTATQNRLWILNGTIIDGTGAPGYTGNVYVEDDTIEEVAAGLTPPSETSARVIDAAGLVVAPGFIDLHSHSDIALLVDPIVPCKLNQGITLELLGQDGMSVAPLTDDVAELWKTHLSGLAGSYDRDWNWRSFAEYLAQFGPTAANVASLVGHGTIRLNVLGMANRPASDQEIDRMCGILRDSLDAGAVGLSGGLVYTPGSFGDLRELVALNKITAEAGKVWVVHIRYEGDRIADGLDEMFRLARETGVALHISHFKVMGRDNWGRGEEIIERVAERRDQGMDITVDQYPYVAGSTMLAAILPPWAHAQGPERLRDFLQDRGALEQMEREIATGLPEWESFVRAAGWENIRISDIGGGRYPDLIGQSLIEFGNAWDVSPFDAAVRLMLEADFAVSMILFSMREDDVATIMRAPFRTGGTDALLGGKPHPRAYGAFPRILGRYVREQGVITLEEAVRQMTGAAAERLRMGDRGIIAPGKKADFCLFDPARVIDRATFEDPMQFPEGITWVIVNGRPVLHDREPTGELPGTVIRQH